MIIGLTGGIATGKSTASHILNNLGIPIVDADKIARKVVEPGMEAYKQIISFFGEGILKQDGSIDRPKLGEIIFNDEKMRNQLNQIVHPAVRSEMKSNAGEHLKAGEKLVVMDIPLLFESKLTHMVDETWLIYTTPELQLQRLIQRDGYTKDQATARIQSQMPIDQKRNLADVVIENNGTIEELEDKLKKQIQNVTFD